MPTILFNSSNFSNMSGLATVDNGLTASTPQNGQLGGILLHDTVINPAAFGLTIGNLAITNAAASLSSAPQNPTDLVRMQDVIVVVASGKGTFSTNFGQWFHVINGASNKMYRISYAISCISVAGGSSMDLVFGCPGPSGLPNNFVAASVNSVSETHSGALCVNAAPGAFVGFSIAMSGATISCYISAAIESVV